MRTSNEYSISHIPCATIPLRLKFLNLDVLMRGCYTLIGGNGEGKTSCLMYILCLLLLENASTKCRDNLFFWRQA